jgi:hypothetical protein
MANPLHGPVDKVLYFHIGIFCKTITGKLPIKEARMEYSVSPLLEG